MSWNNFSDQEEEQQAQQPQQAPENEQKTLRLKYYLMLIHKLVYQMRLQT